MYNEIIIKTKATPRADLTAWGAACFLCDTACFLTEIDVFTDIRSNNNRFILSKWNVFCICAFPYMKKESIILLPIILCILIVIEIIIVILVEILWVVIIMSIILTRFTG